MKNQKGESQIPLLLQVAEVKVKYQSNLPIDNHPRINNSSDAEKIFRINWGDDMELVEEFNVLFLNRANYVKGLLRLSRGGLTGTVADPRILFATALKGLAVGIIAGHNHPSGSCKPSTQDIELTRKLKEIGKLHDIQLIDHIILAPHSGFYSFADEGLL
ncbi:MAG: JAB domain-containing protein [Saprospiraceae bacterium]|nr:JAB domain-containing protein [Candidatus Vicinibacter affinis]